jgi:hypothetical protein
MAVPVPWPPPTRGARSGTVIATSERDCVIAACWFVMAPWAIKRADRVQQQQGRGPLGGGGIPPPGEADQGNQWWKTTVNGNNYGSGRASDDENVDDNDNGSGGGGPASMIKDKGDQAGVATGGNDEGDCLRSRLICTTALDGGWVLLGIAFIVNA